MNNKKLVIVVILLGIMVCLLGGYIVYDKIQDKKIDNTNDSIKDSDGNESKITLSGTYKIGDIINYNESNFDYNMLVINDKDEYVTVLVDINLLDNNYITEDRYKVISDEYYEKETLYNDSEIKKYIESKKSMFSDKLKLKEVDGYEIRLISVDELLALNNDYQEENNFEVKTWFLDSTKAKKEVMKFINPVMTMTNIKYNGEGKIANFYSTGSRINHQSGEIEEYLIDTWASGLPDLKPVVNIFKK